MGFYGLRALIAVAIAIALSPTMNVDSTSERRERAKRGRYLASIHDDIPTRVGRAIVGAEQGFSHAGIAKLPDIDVSESTVRSWLSDVVDAYGDEAVFAKQPAQRKGPIGPSTTIAKHMGYNPDELQAEAESSDQTEFTAEVDRIEETTAGDIYGEDADEPDRELIEVHVTAYTDTDKIEFADTFSLPKGPQSWHNPNFKLGKFRDYYDDLPREDMTVEAHYNDDGYLRIKTEE